MHLCQINSAEISHFRLHFQFYSCRGVCKSHVPWHICIESYMIGYVPLNRIWFLPLTMEHYFCLEQGYILRSVWLWNRSDFFHSVLDYSRSSLPLQNDTVTFLVWNRVRYLFSPVVRNGVEQLYLFCLRISGNSHVPWHICASSRASRFTATCTLGKSRRL